ncbi:hypothetical protein DHODJN_26745 [Methylorubrum extorquens]
MPQPLLVPRFEMPTIQNPVPVSSAALRCSTSAGADFCPGRALSGLVLGLPHVILFVPAVLLGMLLHRFTVGRGPVSRKA